MLLQEFRDDFVLLLQLLLELGDLLELSVLVSTLIGFVGAPLKDHTCVLKQLFLPGVLLSRMYPVLVTQV